MTFSEIISFIQSQLQYTMLEVAGVRLTVESLVIFLGVSLAFILLGRFLVRRLVLKLFDYIEVDDQFTRRVSNYSFYLVVLFGITVAFQMSGIDIFRVANNILGFTLFEINDRPISLRSIIKFLILVGVFIVISRLIRKRFLQRFFDYLKLEEGARYTFSRIIHYTILLLGSILAFQAIGISFSGLAVVFGFLSVGIGFGLQNITSNFISGLILLFERPIQVGDRVVVGDVRGDIEEINIRATKIRSENNISIIVPNSEFVSSNVINLSHDDPRILLEINVGVSYNSDLDLVIKTLDEIAADNKAVMKEPRPQVHLTNFGDSSWDMQLRVWTFNPKTLRQVKSDINCEIVRRFRKAKIEIPFPQRDINFRNPMTMNPSEKPDADQEAT